MAKHNESEKINKAIEGYIMNQGRKLIEGEKDRVVLDVYECIDFILSITSFEDTLSAIATGYIVCERFEYCIHMYFATIATACYHERELNVILTDFVRSQSYSTLHEVTMQTRYDG